MSRPMRAGAARARPDPRWIGGLLLGAALLGLGAWLAAPARTTPPTPSVAAGDEVRILTGGIHTVRHSLRPLPSASEPRPDGLPVLVQFGATWCEVCHGLWWGALFGIVAGSVCRPRARFGLLFGPAVWTASYIALPLARLYKPIWEYDARTLWDDLSAHLVYGLTTAAAFRRLARR